MTADPAAGMSEEGMLTRELLLGGGLPAMLARLVPDIRLTSDAERAASLQAMLDGRPEHGDGLWVFAYGSLIWNPAIHIAGRRLARAIGWHRSYCMSVKAGRGTVENPGLMMGLRQGGECVGAVLRVAEADVALELDLLWRREMVAQGYIPAWVQVEDMEGGNLGAAIAFTINPEGPSYCDPDEAEIVRRIATASGHLGSSAEYLFRTRDGLRALGIRDEFVERISERVESLLNG
jgi:cation transport protein ChaC